MNKTATHLFSNIRALKLSIILSIILNAVLIIGYFYNKNNGLFDQRKMIFSLVSNLIMFYLLFAFNFHIILRNIKRANKFWIAFFGSLLLAMIASLISNELALYLKIDFNIPRNFILMVNSMKDLIVVIIVLLTTYLLYSISEHQQTLIENEKLVTENIRIRYEVLKNQVDPHFLFNCLNTLDGLIAIDTNRAHDYVQNLSSVFRYSIGNKEITYLDEELNFTESYADLMRIRYGENLKVVYDIDSKFRTYYIMPISLQLLVENAIKHNVISNKQPLVVHIESTLYDTIKVWNAIQPKKDAEPGEGIGLANLAERYKLLFQKEIQISSTDMFCVEIPLIKQLNSEEKELTANPAARRCAPCEF